MIEVGRNSIVVRNVDQDSQSFKNMNYNYSIWDKVQHKYTFSAYTLIDNDLYFPASTSVEEIQKYFKNKDVVINYKTTARSGPLQYNMKHEPRNDLQKQSINFLMTMQKDNDNRERFLSLATGSGKTYVTINVISKLKKRAIVVVDTLDLAAQWKREFLNHSDLQDEHIVILSGQDSVDKELKEKVGKIYIAIHRTLGNMLNNDYNSINLLMNKLKIGIRVFDEAHVHFKSICMLNALSNVEYSIFLTATPSRSNFTDDYLYGRIFRRIPYFNGKKINQEKYHTVIMYPMNSKPDLQTKLGVKTKYGFSAARWAQYTSDEGFEYFWETFEAIVDKFKLKERDHKIAILLPTIEFIKKIQPLAEDLGFEVGTFIGEIRKDKRLDELNKKMILTNDKMFDKGIDVEDLEILINFIPFSSLVKTEQIIGRLRYGENKKSILIDIVDYGFEETIKQSKLRKRFYKKKAEKIIEIDLGGYL